jgi:hypothetical protein
MCTYSKLIKCWRYSRCLIFSHTNLLHNKPIRRFKSWEWWWFKSSGMIPRVDCYSSNQRYRVNQGLGCFTTKKEALHPSDTAAAIYQSHMAKHRRRPGSSFTNVWYTLGHKIWASNLLYGKGPHSFFLPGSRPKHEQIINGVPKLLNCRSQWPLACCDRGFESHQGHGCLSAVCCVLSGRGLCDELIIRPEESYRLWRVIVCDQETSWTRRP